MNPSVRLSVWERSPYRLVSLWDIIMYLLKAGDLVKAVNWLKSTQQVLSMMPAGQFVRFTQPEYDQLKENIEFIERLGSDLGLRGVARSAREVLDVIGRASVTEQTGIFSVLDTGRLRGTMTALGNRLPDDLEDRLALVVPASKVEFYEPDEARFGHQFGAEVAQKFRSKGKQEIGDASNCLALGQDTACAFHLMRAVEVALEAIHKCLQLPAPTKGQHKAWGAVLERIREELDRRERLDYVRQWNSMEDRKFFDGVYMSLVAIKDGCRDDTMHVENVYNERQARHSFAITRGFMEKVACRLDEDGQPLA